MGAGASICIITLGRESLYKTLSTIFTQKIDISYEVIIVVQGKIDTIRIDAMNKNNVSCHIFNYAHGLGFGFYRNKAIFHASGKILTWIDDDEWTIDDLWLQKIIQPILDGRYEVVTAGSLIMLGHGYLTDCISLLGWPGGGALGFKKMWNVDSNNITNHLCTGNFAIKKSLIEDIGFSTEAISGGEDNFLARELLIIGVRIFYQECATVYHVPRSFAQALDWWKLRVKNTRKMTSMNFYEEKHIYKKIRFIKNLFSLNRYVWGKLFCTLCILYFFIMARYEG